MDRGIIEDDEAEFLGLGGLGGEGVQRGDGGGGGDAAGEGVKLALVRGAEEAQDIQARAGGAGEGEGVTPRLPGIRHDQREVETALVEIKLR